MRLVVGVGWLGSLSTFSIGSPCMEKKVDMRGATLRFLGLFFVKVAAKVDQQGGYAGEYWKGDTGVTGKG